VSKLTSEVRGVQVYLGFPLIVAEQSRLFLQLARAAG
jgi:hypothetical protein